MPDPKPVPGVPVPVVPLTVYIIEVLVRGAWKPTTSMYVSKPVGLKMVIAMQKDAGTRDYRLAAYARSVA